MTTASSSYLVRYGRMRHVGRFAADARADFPRGLAVVVRSCRGREIGEVLARSDLGAQPVAPAAPARILRAASPDDLDEARRLEAVHGDRFPAYRRVVERTVPGARLLDAEPTLDPSRLALHLLIAPASPPDFAPLGEALRRDFGLEAVVEAVAPTTDDLDDEGVPPSCGPGCGSTGGCGHGHADGPDSPCASCGLKAVLRR